MTYVLLDQWYFTPDAMGMSCDTWSYATTAYMEEGETDNEG